MSSSRCYFIIFFGCDESATRTASDSGAAVSVAEADALFKGYRLRVEIDSTDIFDPVQQAALLTTVALGRRVFLGGVTVTGPLDAPLRSL